MNHPNFEKGNLYFYEDEMYIFLYFADETFYDGLKRRCFYFIMPDNFSRIWFSTSEAEFYFEGQF